MNFFINEKIQSLYIECISQKIKQPIQAKHHVEMNEHSYNSTYIDI